MTVRVRTTGDCITFRCPGCGDNHTVPIPPHPRAWGFNGDLERPTLTPSLLVRSGHYGEAWKQGDPCWCGKDLGFSCYCCHSFVRDGRIEFLSDCTHALAGKTVDLLDVDAV